MRRQPFLEDQAHQHGKGLAAAEEPALRHDDRFDQFIPFRSRGAKQLFVIRDLLQIKSFHAQPNAALDHRSPNGGCIESHCVSQKLFNMFHRSAGIPD